MATKLTTYDFSKPSSLTKTDRRAYPWDEWLDGNIWQIKHGEDFTAHPLMMERIIRTRATARQAKVKLRHEALNGDDSGIIVLRRSDINQPKARKATAATKVPTKKVAVKATKAAPVKKVASKPTKAAPKKAASKPLVVSPTVGVKKAASKKAPARK